MCVGHHYAICSAALARPVYQQTLPVLPVSIWEWILNRIGSISHLGRFTDLWVFIYCMGNFFKFPTWPLFSMLLSTDSQINLCDSTIIFSRCTIVKWDYSCTILKFNIVTIKNYESCRKVMQDKNYPGRSSYRCFNVIMCNINTYSDTLPLGGDVN